MKFPTILLILLLVCSCTKDDSDSTITDSIFQISTLDALLNGDYEGRLTFTQLEEYGDFGVGTFQAVNGELIILDGVPYRATIDGLVSTADPNEETPFAVVKHFMKDEEHTLSNIESIEALGQEIDQYLTTNENPYAILIDASFDSLVVRSVPEQMTPYPPLAEVVAIQTIFTHTDISGSLVGFKFPAYANGINVAGYHFHFVSDDRSVGGHVLGLELDTGSLYIDESSDLIVSLER